MEKRSGLARRLGMFAAAGLITGLAACGGGGGSGNGSGGAASTSGAAATGNGGANGSQANITGNGAVASRVLLIDLDGATYSAVQAGIGNGTLPNLAQFGVQLAYSGGIVGAGSQQPNLDGPSWATLLTGAWANRTQVYSNTSQSVHVSTLFDLSKAVNSSGLNGAVVSSSQLTQMLTPIHSSGSLDTLTDCSQSSTTNACVTGGALALIDNSTYSTVVAQYHSAEDAASGYGAGSTLYQDTLQSLDAAVGKLVSETAKTQGTQWLIVVTSGHGLNAQGGVDGLPLEPESTTFIGLNQGANTGTANINVAVPSSLTGLYSYASIADVTPTLLSFLGNQPSTQNYQMDGGELVGAQPVTQLGATLNNNGSPVVSVTLNWKAPASGAITVFRNGQQIASLPAGTTTYTDSTLTQDLVATGAYAMNYAVAAGTAPRATLVQSISYVQPFPQLSPLAPTLANGLMMYYPFGGSNLPPADALGNSTMGYWASDYSNASLITGPIGDQALQVNPNIADAKGFDGYKLTPASGKDPSTGSQFTIGFWFQSSCANTSADQLPIISNKNYQSGANAGIVIASIAPGVGECGLTFNIGNGSTRADSSPKTVQVPTANQWMYVAMNVDFTAHQLNWYIFSPSSTPGSSTYTETSGTTTMSSALVAGSAGSGLGVYGIGEDGTGTYFMTSCGVASGSWAGASTCTSIPVKTATDVADLAFWNRDLTAAELQSIVNSQQPLSTLLPN
jgi:hypothetical protein